MTYFRWQSKPVIYDQQWLDTFDTSTGNYCLTEQQAMLALTALVRVARWRTRWPDADFDRAQSLVADTILALQSPGTCKPQRKHNPPPIDWYWGPDGSLVLNIYEDCNMPIYVNFYEGCCPDNEPAGAAGAAAAAGAAGGLPISERTTKCDYATSVVPYFVDSVRDWLTDVDIAVTNGATFVDAILGTAVDLFDPTDLASNAVETLSEYLSQSLDGYIAVFEDTDLLLQTQVNWWGRVEQGTRYDNVTRQDLIALGASTPVLWGNALTTGTVSPRALTEILSRIMSLQDINAQQQIARGSGQAGLCEYLATENGETYDPPVSPVAPPPVVFEQNSFTYRATFIETPFQSDENVSPIDIGIFPEDVVAIIATIDVTQAGSAIRNPAYVAESDATGSWVLFDTDTAGTKPRTIFAVNVPTSNNVLAGLPQFSNAVVSEPYTALPAGTISIDTRFLSAGSGTRAITQTSELVIVELLP